MHAGQYEELPMSLEQLNRENHSLRHERDSLLTAQRYLREVSNLESLNEVVHRQLGVVKRLCSNTLCMLQEQQLLHERICASYENQVKALQEDISVLEECNRVQEDMLNAIFQDAQE